MSCHEHNKKEKINRESAHACCHTHSHEHHDDIGHCSCHSHTSETDGKVMLFRLAAGAVLFIIGLILNHANINQMISAIIFVAAYIILGYDVLINAVKNVKHIFNESFLMSIASVGAFFVGELPEAAGIMLFYQIGELLSDYAADKSKDSITDLMDLRAETANVLRNGKTEIVPCESVQPGETIVVSAGEKIPLDGTVISGSAYVDMSAMTGESIPVLCSDGCKVLAGGVNTDSVLNIKVTKAFQDSAASKILELVKTDKQASTEKFITKFARIYTPIVVFCALATAIIPPIFTGDWQEWIYKALLFLVVSCPCALVVSVPLTFFAGIGCASKKGILVKGAYSLENLAKVRAIAFDKTGTLTEGKFKVREIRTEYNANELLELAAYAEYYSSHPIAKAIVSEYGKEINTELIADYHEEAGKGISVSVFGHKILIGSDTLLTDSDIPVKKAENAVYIACDGKYCGLIIISDSLKPHAVSMIDNLKKEKIYCEMLTGDNAENAEKIADKLKIPFHSKLLPNDKVNKIIALKKKGATSFVGDGINDAPVLSNADVAFAMGGIGSDAAIEASDVVIIDDDISKIPLSFSIARKTMRIVKENIVISIGIKIAVMLLGLLGFANMWLGIFADVGVCILAILNASRAFLIM